MSGRFNPDQVWKPFGPFSMVAWHGEGRIAHLKGQVALDEEGRIVGADDMRAQVRQALRNLSRVLGVLGGRMPDILSLTQFTVDVEAFMNAADVRREFFSEPYPVTTTVQVARLYDPALLVEIAAIAEIPRDRFTIPVQAAR